MKRKLLAAILALTVLLTGAAIVETTARMRSAATMAAAANKFLGALTPEQKAKARFSFNDEQRFDWHFIPRERKGLPIKEMNEAQRKIALELLKTGLSQRGYLKASTIMTLENVLREIEGPKRRWPRDPELYFFSIFGAPGAKSPWGWRVEGHHISQNFTIGSNSIVATSPSFFGTNPAEVRVDVPQKDWPQKGSRVLAAEEDLGRDLVKSLDEKQRAKAIYDAKAPDDMISFNKPKAEPLDKSGITADQLNAAQFDKLTKLVEEYCNNVADDLAAARRAKYHAAKRTEIYFAWSGGTEKNDPHYYGVQTPSFLIEYDDTQNNANHIHTVWRDFNGDFGRDLLAEHYQSVRHDATDQASVYPYNQVDVKPKVLKAYPVKLTDEARANGVSGTIIVNFIILADGSTDNIEVVRGLPYGLNEEAINAVRKTRFSPALKAGIPVLVKSRLEFALNKQVSGVATSQTLFSSFFKEFCHFCSLRCCCP